MLKFGCRSVPDVETVFNKNGAVASDGILTPSADVKYDRQTADTGEGACLKKRGICGRTSGKIEGKT